MAKAANDDFWTGMLSSRSAGTSRQSVKQHTLFNVMQSTAKLGGVVLGIARVCRVKESRRENHDSRFTEIYTSGARVRFARRTTDAIRAPTHDASESARLETIVFNPKTFNLDRIVVMEDGTVDPIVRHPENPAIALVGHSRHITLDRSRKGPDDIRATYQHALYGHAEWLAGPRWLLCHYPPLHYNPALGYKLRSPVAWRSARGRVAKAPTNSDACGDEGVSAVTPITG